MPAAQNRSICVVQATLMLPRPLEGTGYALVPHLTWTVESLLALLRAEVRLPAMRGRPDLELDAVLSMFACCSIDMQYK